MKIYTINSFPSKVVRKLIGEKTVAQDKPKNTAIISVHTKIKLLLFFSSKTFFVAPSLNAGHFH